MSETKTATGVCHEITERGEWTTFNVDVGSQYPVRISTKLQPLIELGRAANKAGGIYDWTYKESEGNVNPNTGKPFTNRYLEGVEPASADARPSGGGDGLSKDEWRRKDLAADKRAYTAIAASALQHTMPSTPTREDLNTFMENVGWLTINWLKVHNALRDGEDVAPFEEGPELSEHDQDLPF